MRFGACSSLSNMSLIKAAGYDYAEGQLVEIAKLNNDSFEEACNSVRELGISVETFCLFFKGDIVLVGDNVNFDVIKNYAEIALPRAKKLGGKVLVLGNGSLRRIPEGFPREKAIEQFKKILWICGDIAARNDLKIAIEPLRTAETNLINTFAEGLEFCKKLNHPNVGVLADFFHMYMNGETMEDLENAGKWLLHVHIAAPDESRREPSMADADILMKWADALKVSGYNERMSLECKPSSDFRKALESMSEVKPIFLGVLDSYD